MTDILSKWCGTFDWTPKNPPFISMIEMQSYKVVTFMRMNKYWLNCDTYIQLITFIVFNLKGGRNKIPCNRNRVLLHNQNPSKGKGNH